MLHADAMIYGKAVVDSLRVTIGYPLMQKVNIDTSMATGRAVVKGFPQDTAFVGVGGAVLWHNALFGVPNDSVDVEFTNPSNVQALSSTMFGDPNFIVNGQAVIVIGAEALSDGGGNISPFPPPPPIPVVDSSVASFNIVIDSVSTHGRIFPVAGTYTYHSRFFPGFGVVKVVSNAAIP
jgi:hypothetical protein